MTCTELKILIMQSPYIQIELANKLNISEGQFSKIVNGYRSLNDEQAETLAGLLGIEKNKLLEGV